MAERERGAEQAHLRAPDDPREIRVRPDDLQARLENLPINHPSSPYRDDGSRKPPPLDLSEYELPLPDEVGSPADADLAAGDQARVSADGSWDWRGCHLSPEQSRAADQALAKCREAEGRDAAGNYGDHGLTPAMRRIEAQLDHGHLVEDTERFALKDPDRYKEKLYRIVERYPGADVKDLADSIHDGIRYTFIFDFEHYTESVETSEAHLEEAGYERIEIKPSWHSDEYKGVNSRWRGPGAGPMFEVQFHTQESWDAKQKTHAAYEKAQDKSTSVAEVERLRAYQRQISAEVRVPPDALEISAYKKERRASG